MRPTRNANGDLPMYRHGVSNRQTGKTRKLQNAFEAGLGLAGLAPTKAGAGEKERAYVVRQNSLLRWVLFFIVLMVIACGVAISTFLEVKIARRSAVNVELQRHTELHNTQVKLMHVHLLLQQALKEEVHETSRIEEYKAYLLRALGDHSNTLDALLMKSSVEPEVLKRVQAANEDLRVHELARITEVISHFRKSSTNARLELHKIAHQIVKDVESEAKEDDDFRKIVRQLGESEAFVQREIEREVELDHAEHEDGYNDISDLEGEIENFFKVVKLHEFPKLDEDGMKELQDFVSNSRKDLESDEKETDLEGLSRIADEFFVKHGIKPFPFSRDNGRSIIDHMEMVLEEAKIAPFKQELLDLYDGWKTEDGKGLSPLTVLSGVEKIADENDLYLLLDWLQGATPEDDNNREDYYDENDQKPHKVRGKEKKKKNIPEALVGNEEKEEAPPSEDNQEVPPQQQEIQEDQPPKTN